MTFGVSPQHWGQAALSAVLHPMLQARKQCQWLLSLAGSLSSHEGFQSWTGAWEQASCLRPAQP